MNVNDKERTNSIPQDYPNKKHNIFLSLAYYWRNLIPSNIKLLAQDFETGWVDHLQKMVVNDLYL